MGCTSKKKECYFKLNTTPKYVFLKQLDMEFKLLKHKWKAELKISSPQNVSLHKFAM